MQEKFCGSLRIANLAEMFECPAVFPAIEFHISSGNLANDLRLACERPKFSFTPIDMRLAFVVRLGNDTRPAEGLFEGWVEEVDSCTELRFRSTEELPKFLGQRFELAIASTGKARAGD